MKKIYLGVLFLMGILSGVSIPINVEAQDTKKMEKVKVRNVAIVVYDGVELLDFAGPGEVFAEAKTLDGQSAFNTYTVAASTAPIVSTGFLTITPQYSFETAPKADIVVFPGGRVNSFTDSEKSMTWAKAAAEKAEIAMSVCNGANVLAKNGLLENKTVTSHWDTIPGLRKLLPNSIVLENVRFVDSGQIVTTAGISAGIDGALHVVERLLGTPSAKQTARFMEYNWQPPAKADQKGKK